MEDDLQRIKSVLDKFTFIPDEEWDYASKSIVFKRYKKNEYLLTAGVVAEHSFLIMKGLVRIFYLTETAKEFNRGFVNENNLIGSIGSMIKSLPSRFYIQAIEDTEAALLYRSLIEELYTRNACWERLGRLIAENSLIQIEARESSILDSPEVRYLRFIKAHPDFVERLPQYQIASYLGITDVALSRLRKRVNLINKS